MGRHQLLLRRQNGLHLSRRERAAQGLLGGCDSTHEESAAKRRAVRRELRWNTLWT